MTERQHININRNGIVNGEEPCLAHPKVNGAYITLADLFDLYCTEWGKPHNLVCYLQLNQLLDLEVLQWRREVNGKRLPHYLGSVLRWFDLDTGEVWSYEN